MKRIGFGRLREKMGKAVVVADALVGFVLAGSWAYVTRYMVSSLSAEEPLLVRIIFFAMDGIVGAMILLLIRELCRMSRRSRTGR